MIYVANVFDIPILVAEHTRKNTLVDTCPEIKK